MEFEQGFKAIEKLLKSSKCIIHIDLDCFYCQVEQIRLNIPNCKPLVVQQWNSLIAVNYEARSKGVVRHSTIDEAIKLCPELLIVHVPTFKLGLETMRDDYYENPDISKHKASLRPYRRASKMIMEALEKLCEGCTIQKASIDEAYIDISKILIKEILKKLENTRKLDLEPINWENLKSKVIYSKGSEPYTFVNASMTEDFDSYWKIRLLLAGDEFANKIRQDLFNKLGYTCSCGVSYNKLMAKIASPLNKPFGQSIIFENQAFDFLEDFPLLKIPQLGGKLGNQIKELYGESISQLRNVPLSDMESKLGLETGRYVFDLIRGKSDDPVSSNLFQASKSMMSAKSFRPTVNDSFELIEWAKLLCYELIERLDLSNEEGLENTNSKNQAPLWPQTVIINYAYGISNSSIQKSKSTSMPNFYSNVEKSDLLIQTVTKLINSITDLKFPCTRLSIQLNGLEYRNSLGSQKISSFFVKTDKLDKRLNQKRESPLIVDTENKKPNILKDIDSFFHVKKNEDNNNNSILPVKSISKESTSLNTLSIIEINSSPIIDRSNSLLADYEMAKKLQATFDKEMEICLFRKNDLKGKNNKPKRNITNKKGKKTDQMELTSFLKKLEKN